MRRPSRCIVEGCPSLAHAKGYCRRHYGQIWRRGMIYDTSRRERREYHPSGHDDQERLRTLERELEKAQQMYRVVVGFEGRIKWRRQIEAVQEEIRKLKEVQTRTAHADERAQPVSADQAETA